MVSSVIISTPGEKPLVDHDRKHVLNRIRRQAKYIDRTLTKSSRNIRFHSEQNDLDSFIKAYAQKIEDENADKEKTREAALEERMQFRRLKAEGMSTENALATIKKNQRRKRFAESQGLIDAASSTSVRRSSKWSQTKRATKKSVLNHVDRQSQKSLYDTISASTLSPAILRLGDLDDDGDLNDEEYHRKCVHDVAVFCAGESTDEKKLHKDIHAILMWEKTAGADHRRTAPAIYNKGGHNSRREDRSSGMVKAAESTKYTSSLKNRGKNIFDRKQHHRHPSEVEGIRWTILEEEQFMDYCKSHVLHSRSVSKRNLMASFLQYRRRPTTKIVEESKRRALTAEIKINQKRLKRLKKRRRKSKKNSPTKESGITRNDDHISDSSDSDIDTDSRNNVSKGLGMALVALGGTNTTQKRLRQEAEAANKREAEIARTHEIRANMLKSEFNRSELEWISEKADFVKHSVSSHREHAIRILQRQVHRWLRRRRNALHTIHRFLFRFVLPDMAAKKYRRRKAARKRKRMAKRARRAAKLSARSSLGVIENEVFDEEDLEEGKTESEEEWYESAREKYKNLSKKYSYGDKIRSQVGSLIKTAEERRHQEAQRAYWKESRGQTKQRLRKMKAILSEDEIKMVENQVAEVIVTRFHTELEQTLRARHAWLRRRIRRQKMGLLRKDEKMQKELEERRRKKRFEEEKAKVQEKLDEIRRLHEWEAALQKPKDGKYLPQHAGSKDPSLGTGRIAEGGALVTREDGRALQTLKSNTTLITMGQDLSVLRDRAKDMSESDYFASGKPPASNVGRHADELLGSPSSSKKALHHQPGEFTIRQVQNSTSRLPLLTADFVRKVQQTPEAKSRYQEVESELNAERLANNTVGQTNRIHAGASPKESKRLSNIERLRKRLSVLSGNEREEWAAIVLQKVGRGHSDRMFVRSIRWLSIKSNARDVFSYFDINRDNQLSRGEISNLVHQLLSTKFNGRTTHKYLLERPFTFKVFYEWWVHSPKGRWRIKTIHQKLRLVSVVRKHQRFHSKSKRAAGALAQVIISHFLEEKKKKREAQEDAKRETRRMRRQELEKRHIAEANKRRRESRKLTKEKRKKEATLASIREKDRKANMALERRQRRLESTEWNYSSQTSDNAVPYERSIFGDSLGEDVSNASSFEATSVENRKSEDEIDVKDNVEREIDRIERLEEDRKMLRLFQVVVGELRELLGAHRGTLFIVDNSSQTMWSAVAGGTGKASAEQDVPIRIRINWSDGICGFVRHTRLLMNIPDAYRCKYFNRSVDTQTGYRTKSVLCCAVCHPLNRNQVLAVLQLLNKIDKTTKGPTPFDKEDEQLILKFGRKLEESLRGVPVEKRKRY